ncbi:MAG: hypothetical protein AAF525_18680 [Pseudomonadota bacterium]
MSISVKIFFGIGYDPALVTLLNAARDDATIREQLIAVLSQPSFQRQSLLGLWREELRLEGAPRVLIEALGALQDDHIAEKAGDILNGNGD